VFLLKWLQHVTFLVYPLKYLSRIAISKQNISAFAARDKELLVTEVGLAAKLETETVGLGQLPQKQLLATC